MARARIQVDNGLELLDVAHALKLGCVDDAKEDIVEGDCAVHAIK